MADAEETAYNATVALMLGKSPLRTLISNLHKGKQGGSLPYQLQVQFTPTGHCQYDCQKVKHITPRIGGKE